MELRAALDLPDGRRRLVALSAEVCADPGPPVARQGWRAARMRP